jgi:hypothetical protein
MAIYEKDRLRAVGVLIHMRVPDPIYPASELGSKSRPSRDQSLLLRRGLLRVNPEESEFQADKKPHRHIAGSASIKPVHVDAGGLAEFGHLAFAG